MKLAMAITKRIVYFWWLIVFSAGRGIPSGS
jgi:hypothetical protein